MWRCGIDHALLWSISSCQMNLRRQSPQPICNCLRLAGWPAPTSEAGGPPHAAPSGIAERILRTGAASQRGGESSCQGQRTCLPYVPRASAGHCAPHSETRAVAQRLLACHGGDARTAGSAVLQCCGCPLRPCHYSNAAVTCHGLSAAQQPKQQHQQKQRRQTLQSHQVLLVAKSAALRKLSCSQLTRSQVPLC